MSLWVFVHWEEKDTQVMFAFDVAHFVTNYNFEAKNSRPRFPGWRNVNKRCPFSWKKKMGKKSENCGKVYKNANLFG